MPITDYEFQLMAREAYLRGLANPSGIEVENFYMVIQSSLQELGTKEIRAQIDRSEGDRLRER